MSKPLTWQPYVLRDPLQHPRHPRVDGAGAQGPADLRAVARQTDQHFENPSLKHTIYRFVELDEKEMKYSNTETNVGFITF